MNVKLKWFYLVPIFLPVPLVLSTLTPHLSSVVTNLGIKVDAALRFDKHGNGVVKSSFSI